MKKLNQRLILEALSLMEYSETDFFKLKAIEETKELLKSDTKSFALYQTEGGDWLGVAREYIQQKFTNGDTVTWGSDEELKGARISVSFMEYFAARIAAAAINEFKGRT